MWEQRAAQTTEVADAIRAAEKVSRELQAAAKVGVGAQIGTILTRKGLKVADVVTKWDTSMDGVIDRNEVRKSHSSSFQRHCGTAAALQHAEHANLRWAASYRSEPLAPG